MEAIPSEHEEQVTLIRWWYEWATDHKLPTKALFAIPNAANRTWKTVHHFLDEGMIAGVADLFLCIAAKGQHGLWIEMKRKKGSKWSPEQQDFAGMVEAQGYKYVLAKGAADAIDAVTEYLA